MLMNMEKFIIEIKENFKMKDYDALQILLGVYQRKYRKSIRKTEIQFRKPIIRQRQADDYPNNDENDNTSDSSS